MQANTLALILAGHFREEGVFIDDKLKTGGIWTDALEDTGLDAALERLGDRVGGWGRFWLWGRHPRSAG